MFLILSAWYTLVDAGYKRYFDVGCNGRISDVGVLLGLFSFKVKNENILWISEKRRLCQEIKATCVLVVGDTTFKDLPSDMSCEKSEAYLESSRKFSIFCENN